MFSVPEVEPVLGAPVRPAAEVIDDLFLVLFFLLPNTRLGVLFGSSTAFLGAGACLGGAGGGACGGSGAGGGVEICGPPPPIHISCSPLYV